MNTPLPHVLREYAFLGDGQRGALVDPKGAIVWLCAPSWHSDAVFSSLIGGGGSYSICPSDPWFVWGGYYEDGSLIWRSRWITDNGIVECREALSFPGDAHRAVLLRRVMPLDGRAKIEVRLDPRAEFGRFGMRDVRERDGCIEARTGPLRLRWLGVPVRPERGDSSALVGEVVVEPGNCQDFVLEISDRPLLDPIDPSIAWEATEARWRKVAPDCSDTAAPRDTQHAYAVLRGLTAPGGGMAAAATMSLPERAEAGRNYDYRYAWIRDQCYAGIAIAAHGEHQLVSEAAAFVASKLLEHGPKLSPAYCTDGGRVPDEHQLKHLRGYPGGSDKVGNWVNKQTQLDAFGNSLLLLAETHRVGQLTEDGRRAIKVAVEAVRKIWREPDAGIWELDPDWWAHSRLECVAGLRRLAESGVTDAGEAAEWLALADALLAETSKKCVHHTGRWKRAPDDERVDASLLMAGVREAVPPRDPRTTATIDSVLEELARDGFCYRFRHDERPLDEAEGAFILCGFMMSLALLTYGDKERAARWFERNRSACGTPGLFAEEYDVVQRQLRGNLPQAFVHALMLECSARLGPEPPLERP